MTPKTRQFLRHFCSAVCNFLIFFGMISFVITCSFLLFGSSVTLAEEDVREFAPIVFSNIFILAMLFAIVDFLRRRTTVDRPTEEIEKVLQQLMSGNFSARVPQKYCRKKYREIGKIAGHINVLADELAGVETLRTDFIANVSHEMKTPLAVMQNYGTMLQTTSLSDEKRIEYAKSVTSGARRLADLMTNILKLNKLENQQIYPKSEPYDLGEQIIECLLRFETVWEESHIEIETDIAENVTVSADAELLSLVWSNLLSNAFKFTPDGGRVSVSLKNDGEYAQVCVADNGIGMTNEIGKHIFEKFYQGDTSHATKGNGLGLALVKRVVDIVHGEITVESEPNKGTAFTVRLRRNA